jgi:hypothetical protein
VQRAGYIEAQRAASREQRSNGDDHRENNECGCIADGIEVADSEKCTA